MSDKLKPNFTPIPNVILDEIMRTLAPGATKVLFAICRFTYGWGKPDGDRISLKQLQEITGMARGSVVRSVKELEPLVTVTAGDPSRQLASEYRINVDISDDDLVSLRDQQPVLKRDQASLLASLPGETFQRKSKEKGEGKQKSSSNSKKERIRPPALSLEEFGLTDSLRAWCETEGIPEAIAAAELPKFVDWHLAHGKRPKDPNAAFRNWLRKTREFHPEMNGNGHAKPAEVKDLGADVLEVDGRRMDRATYERRYGQPAA